MKPNVFIPGFPKCGTTALASYLEQHPDVFVIPSKEPGTLYHWKFVPYFMTDPNNFHIGKPVSKEVYEKAFSDAKQSIKVDASQPYSFDKAMLKVLKAYNPKAKIILMIRNQKKRVVSAYNFTYHVHKKDFDKWLNENLLPWLHAFLFTDYLKEAVKVFGKRNVLVIRQEDLKKNPKKVMRAVFNYLGLKPIDVKPISANKSVFSGEKGLITNFKLVMLELVRVVTRPVVYVVYFFGIHKTKLFLWLRKHHPILYIQSFLSRFGSGKPSFYIPPTLSKILEKDYTDALRFCESKGILLRW